MSVLVAGMWGIPHVSRACSCLPPEAPQAAFEQAAAVFIGTAAVVVDDASDDNSMAFRRYEFEVKGSWKGDPPRRVAITTAASSAACGRSFEMGEAYLIYAAPGRDGELVDHLCSRTRPRASADEDLEVLGPPKVPEDEAPPTEPSDREPPRIEPPPAAAPPPTDPPPKGCSVAAAPPVALSLPLLLALARRRRRRA
ncbi:MAG: hypothetical protein R3A79_27080 [Nannocystaceae bacterium]